MRYFNQIALKFVYYVLTDCKIEINSSFVGKKHNISVNRLHDIGNIKIESVFGVCGMPINKGLKFDIPSLTLTVSSLYV